MKESLQVQLTNQWQNKGQRVQTIICVPNKRALVIMELAHCIIQFAQSPSITPYQVGLYKTAIYLNIKNSVEEKLVKIYKLPSIANPAYQVTVNLAHSHRHTRQYLTTVSYYQHGANHLPLTQNGLLSFLTTYLHHSGFSGISKKFASATAHQD